MFFISGSKSDGSCSSSPEVNPIAHVLHFVGSHSHSITWLWATSLGYHCVDAFSQEVAVHSSVPPFSVMSFSLGVVPSEREMIEAGNSLRDPVEYEFRGHGSVDDEVGREERRAWGVWADGKPAIDPCDTPGPLGEFSQKLKRDASTMIIPCTWLLLCAK